MRIAYLVLCHTAPRQTDRLIDRLNGENTDFYIHVDKKVEKYKLKRRDNVYFLPEDYRVEIDWGGYSMIVAEINLMQFFLATGRKYDYVALISGQDYPLRSRDDIDEFLEANRGDNFIDIQDPDSPKTLRDSKRNAIKFQPWMSRDTLPVRIIKNAYISLTGGYSKTNRLFRRKNTSGLTFYYGSQWWVLTYDCVRWMFRYIMTHPRVLDFFGSSLVPDECLFQSVFMASPYADTARYGSTYVDWSVSRSHPKTFTVEDYDTLIRDTDHLFARKFNVEIDQQILDMLDERAVRS